MLNSTSNTHKTPIDERTKRLLDNFDQLNKSSKQFVLTAVGAIADKDVKPLYQLREIHAGNPEIVSVIDDAIQHIEKRNLKRTLQDINLAANSLEIFSHSALASTNDTRTNGRLDDVLMMLRELEQLHADLKRAMEAQQ